MVIPDYAAALVAAFEKLVLGVSFIEVNPGMFVFLAKLQGEKQHSTNFQKFINQPTACIKFIIKFWHKTPPGSDTSDPNSLSKEYFSRRGEPGVRPGMGGEPKVRPCILIPV